jgi:hypothetical protein
MTDPKLNELPIDADGDFEQRSTTNLSEAEVAERRRRTKAGLSIRDTVAGDTTLSVGSTGAGAGAGLTSTTPGNSGSPAPSIVPGARSSGTTPRGDSLSSQQPTASFDSSSVESNGSDSLGHHEIAARAYDCWRERGCPDGSAEEDWRRAEEELRSGRSGKHKAATT